MAPVVGVAADCEAGADDAFSAFSEVLEVFASRYGFTVSSVVMDNKVIKKFPGTYRADLIEKFNVDEW